MSAPYAELDLVAVVEGYTIPRFTPLFVEAMVHGLLDGILNHSAGGGNPADTPEPSAEPFSPAAFDGLSTGAGFPAESDVQSLGAHSAGVQ